jgi:hypothetical protein
MLLQDKIASGDRRPAIVKPRSDPANPETRRAPDLVQLRRREEKEAARRVGRKNEEDA